eukprot:scaffold313785_cov23-Prasinocladus_malaysianus.AAC.1
MAGNRSRSDSSLVASTSTVLVVASSHSHMTLLDTSTGFPTALATTVGATRVGIGTRIRTSTGSPGGLLARLSLEDHVSKLLWWMIWSDILRQPSQLKEQSRRRDALL